MTRWTRAGSTLALFVLCLLFPILPGHAANPDNVAHQRAPKRYAVILVLDGARPDYFRLAPMPNLTALMKRGVTYTDAFVGQEIANTPPGHATIGTGMLPKHHGVEDFLWENPQSHEVEDPSGFSNILAGALEHVMTQHHVPTIASTLKAADPSARVEAVAAHKCYASDTLGGPSADYILCSVIYHNRWVAAAIGNHKPPPGAINNYTWDVPIPSPKSGFGAAVQQWRVGAENSWTVRYGLWAFRRTHFPRVMMMNLAETDVLAHYTTDKSIIRSVMTGFDALLGQIEKAYSDAGLLGRTDFVIVSDHGMSSIRATIPYSALIQSVQDAGANLVYVNHDSAAVMGLVQDSKAREVAENLLQRGGTLVDATYYKTLDHGRWKYLPAAVRPSVSRALERAYVRLANTMASDASADVFAVYAPHVSSRTSVAHGYPWREGHFGPQWDDQHIPFILAGPGIKRGERSSYPARLVDIAPTIEHLLGANPGSVDGVVLQDALTQPSAKDGAAQRSRGAVLRPVVQALERRSGYR